MLRCDYKLNTACNRVSIEANTCIQFEKSDDESIPIGTPVLWDEALMLKIDIDKYRGTSIIRFEVSAVQSNN